MILAESSLIYTKNGDYVDILNHIKTEIEGKKDVSNSEDDEKIGNALKLTKYYIERVRYYLQS